MTRLRVRIALLAMFVFAAPVAAQDAKKRAEKAFADGEKRAKKSSYRDAIERYREASAAYKEAGDAPRQIKSLIGAGRTLQLFGEAPAEALALYTQALTIARATGNRKLTAETLEHVATGRKLTKEVDASVAASREAIGIYDELGDRQAAATALSNIALTYQAAGDAERAAAALMPQRW